MRVYFAATRPCLLRFGNTERICYSSPVRGEIPDDAAAVAEFFPLDGNYEPIRAVVANRPADRPFGCETYRFENTRAIVATRFMQTSKTLRIHGQAQIGEMRATIFSLGGNGQILFEGKNQCKLLDLPPAFRYEAEVLPAPTPFFIVRCESEFAEKSVISLFNENAEEILCEHAHEWEYGESLVLRRTYADIAAHVAETLYSVQNGELKFTERILRTREGFDCADLDERLLPFAFFQEIAAGGDTEKYLTPALLPKKNLLREYLGNFCDVRIPCELFYELHGKINAAALVYESENDVYDVRHFYCETDNGKISNVKPVE